MASKGLKFLLGIALLGALMAFYARPRFPDTASNHGLKTFMGLSFQLIHVVSSLGGWMGFSRVNITRTMLESAALLNRKSDKVEMFYDSMDGVEVLVFTPVGKYDGLRPGIIQYHGGGWVHLSPELYSSYSSELAYWTQSVVVSVKYRLAPEHLYPIPLEDCLKTARYFLTNADQYGVDENKIGITGDSAGGNLAMAVALKLSTENTLPTLKFMSLVYPALQFFDFNLPSYQMYEHGPGFLNKRLMVVYMLLYGFGNIEQYDFVYSNQHITQEARRSKLAGYVSKELLPQAVRQQVKEINYSSVDNDIAEKITKLVTDPFFAPLMASDEEIKILPPTYLLNAEFDVLRDDGYLLASRLEKVGVKLTRSFLSTEEHGFINLISLDSSVADEIRRFAKFFNDTLQINI